jgi:two-component system sensor histidine kinase DegS
LFFKLDAGSSLTEEQVDIFENIGDDIATVLKAGQDRKILYEIRTSEAALAERREVSHYLHDHLGQSLGYLHIKMDQLISQKNQYSLEAVYEGLETMRAAVNESYEIVRGILETIHFETTPVLTNLLLEHARKISQRANFQIDFKTKGQPINLPTEVQRAIFYAFEESLNNAEKHARASKIGILAEWGLDHFILTISDNGIGFNPQSIDTDQHFGMEILKERMAKVNGRITLTTSENSGTIVIIYIPKPSINHLGAEQ